MPEGRKVVELPLVGKGGWAREVSEQFPTTPGLINPETVSLVRQSNGRPDWAVVEIVGEQSYHVALTVEETLKRLGFDVQKTTRKQKQEEAEEQPEEEPEEEE